MTPASLAPLTMLFGEASPEEGPDPIAERILDAAFEQFRLLGIRRSSVDDIAKRAGVGFQLTSPDEVASMALEGIRAGRFWILSELGTSNERLTRRTEEILARRNPEPA